MSAYEITIHEDGCRVPATQTGMFVTQPSSFAVASRKAAALNSHQPPDEWPFINHRTMAEVMRDDTTADNNNDVGDVPIPVLNAEMLGLSGCIEATTPIRGVDWGDLVDRVMSFAVGIVLGVGGVLLLIEWVR